MTLTTEATRRYLARSGQVVLSYFALVATVVAWTHAGAPAPAAIRTLVAFIPAVPVLAAVIATSRYLAEETDPLQRAIQVEAMVWAVGVTFTIATAWGFLEPLAGAPRVPSYAAFAVFSSVVASVQLARRRFPRRRADRP